MNIESTRRQLIVLFVLLLAYPAMHAMGLSGDYSEKMSAHSEYEEKEGMCCNNLFFSPDIMRLEKELKQGGWRSSRYWNMCFEDALTKARGDFKRWEPAILLLYKYDADPNARSLSQGQSSNNTILHNILSDNACHQNFPVIFTNKVIELLVKMGARIDLKNDLREDAVYLALNPSEGRSSFATVLSSGVRLQQFRWFRETISPILLNAHRIEELEFLQNHRFPEEEKKIRKCSVDVLRDVSALCNNVIAIICDYAAGKQIKLREFDSSSARGDKRKRMSEDDGDIECERDKRNKRITDESVPS